MTAAGKDTIYIDTDDEITSIIDKVHSSKQQIVALVLPKRATMLQSSVNMKLLKRAADTSKKNLVLVTSEAGLLSLAGAVGLHVAKTPQSKPEIPTSAAAAKTEIDEALEADEQLDDQDFDATSVANKPVGELSGLGAAAVGAARVKPELAPMPIPRSGSVPEKSLAHLAADIELADETIELDDADDEVVPLEPAGKKLKGKKLKVPNFEKFRLRLILGGLLIIALIVGWILANIILPKAVITVTTNASIVNANVPLTLDAGAKTLDPAKLTVPAVVQQDPKTATQQVATSGQQNNGAKASGSVTMTAGICGPTVPADVPAGTGLTTSGLTYITQQNTSFVPVVSHSKCTFASSSQTTIISQAGGANYNVGPSTFNVVGRSDVSASSGAAMTGGTDSIIHIVTQTDIDSAKQKLSAVDTSSVKTDLQNALQAAGLYAFPQTFNAAPAAITTSANVGDQTDNVTITQAITYVMFGAKQADLQTLIAANVNKQIDTSKQAILDDGFSKAAFSVVTQTASTAQITLQTSATAGPHLDIASLKKQIVGKKAGDVSSIIKANPGVTGVDVHFSPFWVGSTPSKLSKITITIEKPSPANAKP